MTGGRQRRVDAGGEAYHDRQRPVVLSQGRQDPVGDSTAHEIRGSLPQAALQFIERCGHFPWIEQPQPFLEGVETFLSGLPR